MPVREVRRKGKIIGYKWGKTGKLYRGKGAKGKAYKQGAAVRHSGWKGK